MKQTFSIVALSALLVCSCSRHMDYYDESQSNTVNELKNAENKIGVTIDPSQSWVLTEKHTLHITSMPADMVVERVAVMDENPLVSADAAVLAMSAKSSSLSFEAPKGLTRLYAVCIAADGDVRVAEFQTADCQVSFEAVSPYSVVARARGNAARSRRVPQNGNALNWQPTSNALTFGWNDQWAYVERGDVDVHFTNVNYYIDMVHCFLPEGGMNFRDSLNNTEIVRNDYYAVVGAGGGEVTLTPIYRETSNSVSRFGYFYFEPNADRDITTVRKYVFEEGVPFNYFHASSIDDEQTLPQYRLIYYDQDGNPSYTFPEGTHIGFFNVVTNSGFGVEGDYFWYGLYGSNYDLTKRMADGNVLPEWAKTNTDWCDYSHTVMFERGGVKYIGFEDWVKDFDMNDIVLMIDGNVEDLPVAPTGSCRENVKYYRYSYAFEDTRNGDYDMNDVVLRVWRPNMNASYLNVELAAVGAADRIKMYYTNQNGERIALFGGKAARELFEEQGYDSEFFNTQEINAPTLPLTRVDVTDFGDFTYATADFFIVNETNGLEIHMPAALGLVGTAPHGVCMPQKDWRWPKERTSIVTAYPEFRGFANNQHVNVDWWLSPIVERTLTIVDE